MHKEYNQSPRQVLEDLHAAETGLSGREAETRLGQYGPNRLREAPKATLLQRFIQQLKDPMLLILMAAAAVSAVTNYLSHEPFTEVLIILAVVLLNAVLGVVQESKAEAAIEALQSMTAATSKVLRDGSVTELESSRLVPGDIVLLEAGDRHRHGHGDGQDRRRPGPDGAGGDPPAKEADPAGQDPVLAGAGHLRVHLRV